MNTENKKKTPVRADRISLEGEARDRVNRWTEDLNRSFKGLRLSKGDLVNYLICARPEVISPEDAQKIRNAYFDEIRFASWILKEVKAAQKRGESTSLEGLLAPVLNRPKVASPRKPKSEPKLGGQTQPETPQTEVGSNIGNEGVKWYECNS